MSTVLLLFSSRTWASPPLLTQPRIITPWPPSSSYLSSFFSSVYSVLAYPFSPSASAAAAAPLPAYLLRASPQSSGAYFLLVTRAPKPSATLRHVARALAHYNARFAHVCLSCVARPAAAATLLGLSKELDTTEPAVAVKRAMHTPLAVIAGKRIPADLTQQQQQGGSGAGDAGSGATTGGVSVLNSVNLLSSNRHQSLSHVPTVPRGARALLNVLWPHRWPLLPEVTGESYHELFLTGQLAYPKYVAPLEIDSNGDTLLRAAAHGHRGDSSYGNSHTANSGEEEDDDEDDGEDSERNDDSAEAAALLAAVRGSGFTSLPLAVRPGARRVTELLRRRKPVLGVWLIPLRPDLPPPAAAASSGAAAAGAAGKTTMQGQKPVIMTAAAASSGKSAVAAAASAAVPAGSAAELNAGYKLIQDSHASALQPPAAAATSGDVTVGGADARPVPVAGTQEVVALHWSRHSELLAKKGKFAYVQLGWLHRHEQSAFVASLLQSRMKTALGNNGNANAHGSGNNKQQQSGRGGRRSDSSSNGNSGSSGYKGGIDLTLDSMVSQWYRGHHHNNNNNPNSPQSSAAATAGAEAVVAVAVDAAARRFSLEVLEAGALPAWVRSVYYGDEPLRHRLETPAPDDKATAIRRRTAAGRITLAFAAVGEGVWDALQSVFGSGSGSSGNSGASGSLRPGWFGWLDGTTVLMMFVTMLVLAITTLSVAVLK